MGFVVLCGQSCHRLPSFRLIQGYHHANPTGQLIPLCQTLPRTRRLEARNHGVSSSFGHRTILKVQMWYLSPAR